MAVSLSFLMFLLISSSCGASACERCVRRGKAAYSPSLSPLPHGGGVCGYGAMAAEINGGFLAVGGSRQHRGGLGCGRCFQMRCRDAKLCSSGVRVVLTDFHRSNRTDFLLSGPSFVGLAKPGMANELKRLDALSVEYKRIPCDYKDKNLSLLVEEHSQRPNYLVVKLLYQGGQTDIHAVEVAQVGSSDWRFMARVYGPVWSTDRAPAGPLQFRVVVTGGYDGKWVWAEQEVLPANWRPGQVYDTGVRIADVAKEGCQGCATLDWK
ncbi:expansin-like A3 [Phragmites australis]|uniref:expansin-like A3 n=1 Tax=Phragmites australis TaxID=29695 RepID=UPI002D789F8C|nr:expansin-like A3 [Phragmites australis]